MYGNCVEDVETDVIKSTNKIVEKQTIYIVRLHLDWPALIMWSLYFAPIGKLMLDLLSMETKFLIPAIAGHADRAEYQYVEYYNRQISDEEKRKFGNKTKPAVLRLFIFDNMGMYFHEIIRLLVGSSRPENCMIMRLIYSHTVFA